MTGLDRSGLICAPYSTHEHGSPLRCYTLRTLENVLTEKKKVTSDWNWLSCSTAFMSARVTSSSLAVLSTLVSLFWDSPSCSTVALPPVALRINAVLPRLADQMDPTSAYVGSNLWPRVFPSHKLECFFGVFACMKWYILEDLGIIENFCKSK